MLTAVFTTTCCLLVNRSFPSSFHRSQWLPRVEKLHCAPALKLRDRAKCSDLSMRERWVGVAVSRMLHQGRGSLTQDAVLPPTPTCCTATPQVDDAGKARLLKQLEGIDTDYVNRLFKDTMAASGHVDSTLEPMEDVTKLATATAEDKARWFKRGLEAVAGGEVAALVLAGGQGSRLGFDRPKGEYNLGLPSNKTLFQIQVRRCTCWLCLVPAQQRTQHTHICVHATHPPSHPLTDLSAVVPSPWLWLHRLTASKRCALLRPASLAATCLPCPCRTTS